MLRSRCALVLALLTGIAGLGLGVLPVPTAAPSGAQGLDELRRRARPADERLARGPQAEELRARLRELDHRLDELAAPGKTPAVQALHEVSPLAELDSHRDWTVRAWPALAPRLGSELCGTPPREVPPREQVAQLWRHGQRLAAEAPHLLRLRTLANLLAWRALFEAQRARDEREPWEAGPEEVLASTFPLAYAFDDGSLLGTMVRIAVEEQALRAARALLERGTLSASALRRALEPWLARSLFFEPSEMIEGELRAALALVERVDGAEGETPEWLAHFADVEDGFALARRPAAELLADAQPRSADGGGFAQSCRGPLANLHRHRSLLAVWRVALALLEYRERSGNLPEHLDALASAFPDGLPRDPLSGAPIPYRFEHGCARLGPPACPEHGSAAGRRVDWAAGVEQMLAWEFSLD